MTKKVSAAQAKAHLSSLVAEVAFGGARIIIERRGRPLAALVSMAELERLEQGEGTVARARGALALVGAWRDVPDDDLDRLLIDIYKTRERDTGRPVKLDA